MSSRGKGRGRRPGGEGGDIGPPSTISGIRSTFADMKLQKEQRAPVALIGSTKMAPCPGKGTICRSNGRVKIRTNLMIQKLSESTVLWPYHVTIHKGEGNKRRFLTRGSQDDYHRSIKRERCYEIMAKLFKDNEDVFPTIDQLIYDRAKMLHSLVQLKGIGPNPTSFKVNLFDRDVQGVVEYTVLLERSAVDGIQMSDIKALCNPDLNLRNFEAKKLIELVTSQTLLYRWNQLLDDANPNKFLVMGDKMYSLPSKKQLSPVCGPKYTVKAFKKSEKVIEGHDQNNPQMAMSIEVKLTAFFNAMNMIDIMRVNYSNVNLNEGLSDRQLPAFKMIHRMLKELIITHDYTGRKGNFECRGLSLGSSAASHSFSLSNGNSETVASYFAGKYGKQLAYPNLPCLVDEKGGMFPMELCSIAPYQRVPITKQSNQQMKETIRDAAMVPSIRLANMEQMVKQAKLRSNQWLSAAGMQVMEDWMVVDGRLLPMPSIKMKGSIINPDTKGEWRMVDRGRAYKWLVPGTCTRAAILNFAKFGGYWNETKLKQFWDKYVNMANQTGLVIPTEGLIFANVEEGTAMRHIEHLFSTWANQETSPDFVLSILPNENTEDVHCMLKYHELMTGIQTQNLKETTVDKVLGERGDPVLLNVIAKSNVKLGGVDSAISFNHDDVSGKWLGNDVMIMGLDVNHPPPQSARAKRKGEACLEPSVVGLAATTGESIFELTGDHWFVSARDENQVKYLDEHVDELVSRLVRPGSSNRKLPEKVIFYRDGVSDSQMIHAMTVELEMVKRGLRAAATRIGVQDYEPKITFLLVIKRHNERFFKQEIMPNLNDKRNAVAQNIQPGLVVDSGIVHPSDFEFYLNAHQAITGTAQTPKYRVLINELNVSSDEMQNITHTLCYGHQIISKPVSLPVPVYSAHDLAKRGKEIYRAYKYMLDGGETESGSGMDPEPDWRQLSARMSIAAQKKLKFKKHWA